MDHDQPVVPGVAPDACGQSVKADVSAFCDRIVVIAQGKVVADGTPDELRSLTGRDNLEDAFVALSGLELEGIS